MNRLIVSLLFLIFASFALTQNEELTEILFQNKPNENLSYRNGLLKNEFNNFKPISNYKIEAELKKQNIISAKQSLIWINRTNFETSQLYFHLYPNAYKNTKTEFAKAYQLEEIHKSFLDIESLFINGKSDSFEYDFQVSNNINDSTVIRIDLDFIVRPNDSVKIDFLFQTKIPLSLKRFGYAEGRDFSFISQWFPKIGVFENGKWVCPPYYSYTNFYSNFGNYEAKITVPKNYKVGATGVLEEKILMDSVASYKFIQSGIHDFAWFVTDSILYKDFIYKRNDNSEIQIELFVQPERDEYFERYKSAVENCLHYFEKNVGKYPYQKITLVDVPRTSKSGGMEYPTLFTVSADLFSPEETGYPEKLVAHEFAHQYFYGIVANNETYEGWIDEGLSSYFATKIVEEYYPELLINFKLATYFPVFGIQLLNYNEIPLIYSIDTYKQDPSYSQYLRYYKNPIPGKISDSSFIHESKIIYRNTNYSKPELMFLSLERIFGKEKFLEIINQFYNKYKFKHPKGIDLINLIKSNADKDLSWFFENVFYGDAQFDYSVNSITETDSLNYKIELIRNQEGVFYNDVLIVTEKDSIWQTWQDSSRTKEILIKTKDELIGVEIDPFRKNVFDKNFANNSMKTSSNIWPALSLSIRWFFWIQNALMVLGSFG